MDPRIRQYLILGSIGVVLLLGLLGFLLSGGNEPPSIIRISSESSEEYLPRPQTTITLSRELEEGESVFIGSFPTFLHTIKPDATEIVITPTQDLDDGVPFDLKIFYRESDAESIELEIPDEFRAERSESAEDLNVYSFRTAEFTTRRDFLRTLPQTINGNYTLVQLSERTILVTVIRGTEASRKSEVTGFLASKGITEPRYTISYSEPADLDLFPTPPDGFEQFDSR